MRNVVSGTIGALFGGFVLVSSLLRGGPKGEGAFFAGQMFGLVLGLLMLLAGAYYLVGGIRSLQDKPSKAKRKRRRRKAAPDEEED